MILSYAAALFSFNFRFRIKEDVGRERPRRGYFAFTHFSDADVQHFSGRLQGNRILPKCLFSEGELFV